MDESKIKSFFSSFSRRSNIIKIFCVLNFLIIHAEIVAISPDESCFCLVSNALSALFINEGYLPGEHKSLSGRWVSLRSKILNNPFLHVIIYP
jgi:hypothetical protein